MNPLRRFALACAVVSVGVLIPWGCASSSTRPSQPGPTTRVAQDDALLPRLRQQRAELAAEVADLRESLAAFQAQHPSVDMLEVTMESLQAISQAYVAAQLATIEARTRYAEAHPAVLAAERHEQELHKRYEQALRRFTDVNRLARDRERLQTDLAEKREALRRLDDRIAHLEDRQV